MSEACCFSIAFLAFFRSCLPRPRSCSSRDLSSGLRMDTATSSSVMACGGKGEDRLSLVLTTSLYRTRARSPWPSARGSHAQQPSRGMKDQSYAHRREREERVDDGKRRWSGCCVCVCGRVERTSRQRRDPPGERGGRDGRASATTTSRTHTSTEDDKIHFVTENKDRVQLLWSSFGLSSFRSRLQPVGSTRGGKAEGRAHPLGRPRYETVTIIRSDCIT